MVVPSLPGVTLDGTAVDVASLARGRVTLLLYGFRDAARVRHIGRGAGTRTDVRLTRLAPRSSHGHAGVRHSPCWRRTWTRTSRRLATAPTAPRRTRSGRARTGRTRVAAERLTRDARHAMSCSALAGRLPSSKAGYWQGCATGSSCPACRRPSRQRATYGPARAAGAALRTRPNAMHQTRQTRMPHGGRLWDSPFLCRRLATRRACDRRLAWTTCSWATLC